MPESGAVIGHIIDIALDKIWFGEVSVVSLVQAGNAKEVGSWSRG